MTSRQKPMIVCLSRKSDIMSKTNDSMFIKCQSDIMSETNDSMFIKDFQSDIMSETNDSMFIKDLSK